MGYFKLLASFCSCTGRIVSAFLVIKLKCNPYRAFVFKYKITSAIIRYIIFLILLFCMKTYSDVLFCLNQIIQRSKGQLK